MILNIAWLAACNREQDLPQREDPPESTVTAPVPFSPAPATLYRLSDAEWRNSAEDLFGVRYDGTLPVDYLLYNYTRVGGSELTIPPLDLEQYETAAWEVAGQAAVSLEQGELLVGCDISDAVCVRSWVSTVGMRAWRRPLDSVELDELMGRWQGLVDDGEVLLALQATVASLVLSPDFVFRVELGQEDPSHPGWRRYTSWEMASRLASFLTATVPDEELVRAALADELQSTDALLAQTDRLLQTDRAREALVAFFSETLELHELETVNKGDPVFTDALRTEMALELELLFRDVALDRDADLGELLTSETAFLGPELAGLYGVPSGPGVTELTLPAAQERGGLLGRAGFLTVYSHATVTSPTLRGKFVQTRLLCQDIPPPPPGVATELEPVEGGTLRQQLEEHATNPACASCHTAIDPPGFALEHFDPLGRRRELDNGLPIDATGELEGAPFDGARELGEVIAANPKYTECLALELYRFANAQLERREDLGLVSDISAAYGAEGRRFRALVYELVKSDAFRLATAPRGEVCTTEGETRSCATDCGSGTEICASGRWSGCTAPAPDLEACNGADDDCDGQTDEAVERSCTASTGPGVQVCEGGAWLECVGPGPADEVCNGVDDDQDGLVDEEMEILVTSVSTDDLLAAHAGCDPWADAFSPDCHAAASRACANLGCSVTGYGPLVVDSSSVELACLDETQATVIGATFTELSGYHYGCNVGERQGGACNAAISRLCGALGLTTGFGPFENSGDYATIACTPAATVYNGSYAELSGYDAGCNTATRVGASCNHAIHQWCRAQGHETGHGPLENFDDLAVIACLGVL
jgi:hypothetical protein